MRYRTKTYFALLMIAIVSSLTVILIFRYQVKKIMLTTLRTNVMSIAADSTTMVDINDIIKIKTEKNEDSLEYSRIQNQLQHIRDVNRRNDVYVKYVYILAPTDNKESYVYIVDAEDKDSLAFSHIGDTAYEAVTTDLIHNNQSIYAPTELISDNYGDWLMGYAPLFDKKGNYVATIGINLYATAIMNKLALLDKIAMVAFICATLFALVAGWFISSAQTKSLHLLRDGVRNIEEGNFQKRIVIPTEDEFGELAHEINIMSSGLQEREKILVSFSRYVSQHIMDKILKSDEQIKLSGETRRVTILFTDIRNFTQFSEKHKPEEVVSLLNEYFSAMVEVVFKNNGILDKFIGDGMMVEFGAPIDDGFQEYHAVMAAIEMQRELTRLCKKWESEGRSIFDMGISIHAGDVVIGNIGSEKRIEYTAIGDTVNVASRIEHLNKELETKILISASAVYSIWDKFNFIDVGLHLVRGRSQPIQLYTVDLSDNEKKL